MSHSERRPPYPRNSAFTIDRSTTRAFGDTLLGHPYTEELAGPDGCHVHVWIPSKLQGKERTEKLLALRDAAHHQWDVVSMSWDYHDEPVECRNWTRADLSELSKVSGFTEVRWDSGKKVQLDNFTRSALVAVYQNINPDNQAKMQKLLDRGPAGMALLADKCFTILDQARGTAA